MIYSNRRNVLPAEIIGRNRDERRLWRIETLLIIPVDEIIIFLLSSEWRNISAFKRQIRFYVSSQFRPIRNRTIFLYIYMYYIMVLPEKVGRLFHVEERRCPYRPRLFYTSAMAE